MRYIIFLVTSKNLGSASTHDISQHGFAAGLTQISCATALASVGCVQILPDRIPAKQVLQTVQQSQDTILKHFAY